jgi:potassium-transporting ATPase KdpC subunit
MRRQLLTGLTMTVAMTVLLGLAYPLVVTGIGQVVFHQRANGSLVRARGRVVGSSLLAQDFTQAKYFQPRPSAAGKDGYDPTASGGSNLGPSNPALLKMVADRVAAYRKTNGLAADAPVPVDAVTASFSGLDPQISVANADIQARRVALARCVPLDRVLALVRAHTENRPLGVLGEKVVNVLAVNLALDRQG